ncbi:MAG: hypothetical protein AAB375_00065 [Patescibacteria group bacterium]
MARFFVGCFVGLMVEIVVNDAWLHLTAGDPHNLGHGVLVICFVLAGGILATKTKFAK